MPTPVPVPAPPVEYQAQPVARPTGAAERRRFDWVIGIVLGIVLGLGVATAFVFIGSEDTVDAPQVRGDAPARTIGPDPNGRAEPERVPAE
ncbi:MAG TPA: hypothetical protein VK889_02815 [Solirubrobacterales bacterium]|nr:hypothetical protein [Solirubrobacterales bacterium]